MICLAQGHYSFECPEAPFNQFKADVMCTICGDKGAVEIADSGLRYISLVASTL